MQATMTLTHNRLWLGPFLAMVIALAMLAALSAHAIEKHGQEAVIVSQCADFPQFKMVNPETGRIASICLTPDGWGVYIAEADGRNVTAFLKNKLRSIEQVIRYMQNRGYQMK